MLFSYYFEYEKDGETLHEDFIYSVEDEKIIEELLKDCTSNSNDIVKRVLDMLTGRLTLEEQRELDKESVRLGYKDFEDEVSETIKECNLNEREALEMFLDDYTIYSAIEREFKDRFEIDASYEYERYLKECE